MGRLGMKKHVIGNTLDLPVGTSRIVDLEGKSVGVFNVKGSFYALKNSCPHQGAPLCVGPITGMTLPSEPGEYIYGRNGEIIRCPWHGWEFDLTTGKSIFDPESCKVKAYKVTIECEQPSVETYPVTIESGKIVVHL
jgi:nitrite reductase/ring-hydroxylating ferredoxin subunit